MAQGLYADPLDSSYALEKTNSRSWLIVLIAALFSFYEFLQMNMFDSISTSLMHAFNVDAAKLGLLSSFYFIANVVFLVVAGILLDRFSTRRVILFSLAICIIGTALFSSAHSFAWACTFRFLTGIGSAFCFLSIIRLASRWFPPKNMAFVIGLVLTIAMFGAWVSQTPIALLAHAFDWRVTLKMDAALGVVVFLFIFAIVKDFPAEHAAMHEEEQKKIQAIGFFKSLRMAFFRLQNWLVGFYVCFVNLPAGLLGGLWGVLYLTHTHNISHVHATEVSSMLFIGAMIGSPLAGFISDKMGMRRPPLLVGALVCLGLISLVMFDATLSFDALFWIFLLIGIFSYVQVIGYPLVAENSTRMLTAMSVCVVNISVQGGSGLFQPIFGYLLDNRMMARAHVLSTHYLPSDFSWAMLIFPIGFILAILIVFVLPETHCKQKVE
ncbi:MAG TPA: MFS transporter [Coxiellaceae bacterium]|nr:MAG: hypothetical protein A3E81_05120 [Gammaproteobacteria bacterium RIFCSPHIGHO2_12_FULL_36_30]HLB55860.1 MFS transporter [Coxiellaceae bacterium]